MEALLILITFFGVLLALINLFVVKDKDPVKIADWLEDHSYVPEKEEEDVLTDPAYSFWPGNIFHHHFCEKRTSRE